MAEIRLRLREANGGLPDVCMCCGEPSTVLKSKNMSWCPPWVLVLILAGLLPYAIVATILTRRATIQAPLCDQHKGHWFKRTMWNVGTFFLFAAICGGMFFLGVALGDNGRQGDTFMGIACGLSALLGVTWLIILIVAQYTAIRPKEITDKDIPLTNVAKEFVDAVDEQDREDRPRRRRDSRDDGEDYDDRPRKKRPAYDDDDDEPRAKKKRPPVEDDEDDAPRPRKKRPSSDAIEE